MNKVSHDEPAEEHLSLTSEPDADHAAPAESKDALVKGVATVGVIAVGVALIEVALIPGMIIGVAAAFAPKYLPQLGANLQPMFRSTVRNLYKFNRKTREAVAEAQEKVRDIVAEVHAEHVPPVAEPTTHPHA
jgi:hypothetical protein